MANTVQTVGHFVECIPDNSADFDVVASCTGHFPIGEVNLEYIMFAASGANDEIVVRHSSATGPLILGATDVVGGGLVIYPKTRCRPYLVAGSCAFATTANVIITFGFSPS